ncbi:MAG: hypothetical protein R8K22_09430 [Mariprofundaceae bacterium]
MSEQTLTNFYAGCDGQHREFFSVLIHEWEELGLPWEWQDKALAFGYRSVIHDCFLTFFRLHAGGGVNVAMITLDHDEWGRRLGIEEADRFFHSLTTLYGIKHKRRDEELRILAPGHLSGPQQSELRSFIRKFGSRLPEFVAS